MAIVDLSKKGKNKTLTAKEIKERTLKATGWTSEQYQREYDKLRNKVRNYERAVGESKKIAVNELLYTTQASQKKYGEAYKPSRLVRAILATPSTGTGVVQRQGVSARTQRTLERQIMGEFAGFTSKTTEGARIKELYERQKGGQLAGEIAMLREKLSQALEAGEPELAEDLANQIRELESAPKNIAELKKQLTSAAKSLKEYKKNKLGEWRKAHPDSPYDYAVGSP